jgi:hypothetical protein
MAHWETSFKMTVIVSNNVASLNGTWVATSNFNKLNKMKGISGYSDRGIVPDGFATQVCTSIR